MSVWGMGVMVGPIMGPVIGGWLTDNYNWRWCFYINVPVGAATFAILWFLLPSRAKVKRSFDAIGFAFIGIAVAAFQLMLDRGQEKDWFSSWEICIEAMVAGAALWIALVHLATASKPLFDRHLFRNRNLTVEQGLAGGRTRACWRSRGLLRRAVGLVCRVGHVLRIRWGCPSLTPDSPARWPPCDPRRSCAAGASGNAPRGPSDRSASHDRRLARLQDRGRLVAACQAVPDDGHPRRLHNLLSLLARRRAALGARLEKRQMQFVMMATVLAGIWSLMSGTFVLMTLRAAGLLA
eukprot:gene32039-42754_t